MSTPKVGPKDTLNPTKPASSWHSCAYSVVTFSFDALLFPSLILFVILFI